MKGLYLAVNAAVLLPPLLMSFDRKVNFASTWKAFLPANLVVAAAFVAWDVWFTARGIWGFNPDYLVGLKLGGLPLEEILFFLCIPYASVFTYAVLKAYVPKDPLRWGHASVSLVAAAVCLAVAIAHPGRWYTVSAASLTAVFLGWALLAQTPYMGRLWFTYFVLLVPFVVTNGVLTGVTFWEYPLLHHAPEQVVDHIVWYANPHTTGWRIFSMPVDDLIYGFLLIGLNVALYERFSRRTAPY
jgi:lycopene cyclase domain-containing protein